jgi:hypothetical protein
MSSQAAQQDLKKAAAKNANVLTKTLPKYL